MKQNITNNHKKTAKNCMMCSTLSKELRHKYKRRSIRIRVGDIIKIMRGEYKGVDGKVSKVLLKKYSIFIEGVKREKSKGEKIDVHIHPSDVMVTNVNMHDKYRKHKLENEQKNKADYKNKQQIKN